MARPIRNVTVNSRCRHDALTVPSAAVQVGQNGEYVFVVNARQPGGVSARNGGPHGRRHVRDRDGPDAGRARVVIDGIAASHQRQPCRHPQSDVAAEAGRRVMNLPELCIRRPVMTTLLMLAFVVFGLFSYRLLPVAAMPRVDFPTIVVIGALPGASPETMASSVATPLEKAFSTIAGLNSMVSSSGQGATAITMQFDLDAQHRRRGARRAIGNLGGGALSAAAIDDAAQLHQAQPGRPAGDEPGVGVGHDAALRRWTNMPRR